MSTHDGSTPDRSQSGPIHAGRLLLLPALNLHLSFVPAPPTRGAGCVVCHRRRVEMQCERCGLWMHWACFMEAIADERDRQGIQAEDHEDRANWRVLLCVGCRS
jgi:hypothetical protein